MSWCLIWNCSADRRLITNTLTKGTGEILFVLRLFAVSVSDWAGSLTPKSALVYGGWDVVNSTIFLQKKKKRLMGGINKRLNSLLMNTVWVSDSITLLINSWEEPELTEITYPAPSLAHGVLGSISLSALVPHSKLNHLSLPPRVPHLSFTLPLLVGPFASCRGRRRCEEPSGCPGLLGETLNGADSWGRSDGSRELGQLHGNFWVSRYLWRNVERGKMESFSETFSDKMFPFVKRCQTPKCVLLFLMPQRTYRSSTSKWGMSSLHVPGVSHLDTSVLGASREPNQVPGPTQ